jgi:hypothetical protein
VTTDWFAVPDDDVEMAARRRNAQQHALNGNLDGGLDDNDYDEKAGILGRTFQHAATVVTTIAPQHFSDYVNDAFRQQVWLRYLLTHDPTLLVNANIWAQLPDGELTEDVKLVTTRPPVESKPGLMVTEHVVRKSDKARHEASRPPQTRPPALTEAQRKEKQGAALARIATKIRSLGSGALAEWVYYARPGKKWLYLVAESTWGEGWRATDWEKVIIETYLCGCHHTDVDLWARMAEQDETVRRVLARPGWKQYWESDKTRGTWLEVKVTEQEAARHNHDMHALNGNVIVVTKMEDVTAAPEYKTL